MFSVYYHCAWSGARTGRPAASGRRQAGGGEGSFAVLRTPYARRRPRGSVSVWLRENKVLFAVDLTLHSYPYIYIATLSRRDAAASIYKH